MNRLPFGVTKNGEMVERITLSNDQLTLSFLTLGAVLQDVRLAGVPYPLTPGSDRVEAYLGPLASYGAMMGPVVNRIRNAQVTIGAQRYRLEKNLPGQHCLHSGSSGTQSRVFDVTHCGPDRLDLTVELPDGACGLPGNRRITVSYRLSHRRLSIEVTGETDAPTLMNLSNHSYWNLDGSPTYAGHKLTIAAKSYLPTDKDLIPTGQVRDVTATEFDFRESRVLTASADSFYDHNFCLARARGPLRPVAKLTGQSGVMLTVETTEPGLQFYDGAKMNSGAFTGHSGAPYGPYQALALETQAWPDAPANPTFPPINLNPGQQYRALTRYEFGHN